jgi:pimeloyl-ACP methyl ester carboxylesterase/tetratricopeptide (TPR) repeat protein
MKEGRQLLEIRTRPGAHSAMLFVHGFTGDSDETWDRFPLLLGAEESLNDWDILSLGYNTSFLPGTRGIWSADPELPILAKLLQNELEIIPLGRYGKLAIIAHSMGGLVVQAALVANPELVNRIGYVLLFGTPSAGLRKARIMSRLLGFLVGEQIHNMASDGEFVSHLRRDWSRVFGADPPFQFYTIAGDKDQFVTPDSSLDPFAPRHQRVVRGDHLGMVKPHDKNTDAVRLLVSVLGQTAEPEGPRSPLRIAAEVGASGPTGMAIAEAGAEGRQKFTTQEQVVEAALALDRANKRSEAIELLQRYKHLGTDVAGTLAGRIKRRWLQDGDEGDAKWALELYETALRTARAAPETQDMIGQVFYHAINVAFLKQVAFERTDEAREMAQLALEFAQKQTPPDVWSVATEAEAHLYLGEYDQALAKYKAAVEMKPETWKLVSAGQQAQQVAGQARDKKLQDRLKRIQEALKEIFDPRPKRINRIFVSYSHKNSDWRDKLETMLMPLLTERDELDLWADNRIPAGTDWFKQIHEAMATCRVAVLLVSAEFLASEFIRKYELPAVFQAVEQEEVRLIWLYLSPSIYEETKLANYQAAHDLSKPLDALPEVEQRRILKESAFKIKEAMLA